MTATATRNGHGDPDVAREMLSGSGGIFGALKRLASGRVPVADLDERDPDYIRETLPRLWLLSSLWFRGEVRGLGNVPEDGPVLLVGNHSGGNLTPDTTVFTLAFSTYFGVERAFHQLAHNLVLAHPALSFLRKYGTVAASMENARVNTNVSGDMLPPE
jgi:1-acyl-sn-glycerol-3-phosphate acyltransferase